MPTPIDSVRSLSLRALSVACTLAVVAIPLTAQAGPGPLLDAHRRDWPLQPRHGNAPHQVAWADVDGDGDLDLVLTRGVPRLYLNDGSGRFENATAARLPRYRSSGVAWGCAAGDVDNDGDVDLAFGGNAHRKLYLNDGRGNFTDVSDTHLPRVPSTLAVALGDTDGDGDLDWIGKQVLRNDGRGHFKLVAGDSPRLSVQEWEVTAGDVDGDGDLDIVLALGLPGTPGPRLLLNDGRGRFRVAPPAQLHPKYLAQCVALADLDGDGDLDMVVGTRGPDVLLRNNGRGTFVPEQLPRTNTDTWGCTIADIDGDGQLDAVFAGTPAGVLIGCAGGRLCAPAAPLMQELSHTAAAAAADIDDDGDVDVFIGPDHVLRNRTYDLEAPQMPRLGARYPLVFQARSVGAWRVLPAIALAPPAPALRIPALGTLRLAVASMVVLPPLDADPRTGLARLELRLPRLPWLVGLTISSQGLIVPRAPGSSPRLTGLQFDVIQR